MASDEVRELKLYIDNDSQLYRSQTTSILKNLMTKRGQGQYDPSKAVKLWMYLVDAGAKKYAKEHGSPGDKWNEMFTKADREAVAKEMNDDFEAEAKLGNYDDLLPKKYQKKTEASDFDSKREGIATDLATAVISKASKELQQWVTFKTFKPDLVKLLIRHIETPKSEAVFDSDRRLSLMEAAGGEVSEADDGEDDDPRGKPKMLRKLSIVKVEKAGVMRIFVYKSKSTWSLPFVTVVQGSDGSELPGSSGASAAAAIKNTKKLLVQAGAKLEAADEDGEDETVTYGSKDLGVAMHHWHSGQGDPIYGVGSMIFARKPVPKADVEEALSSLESLLRGTTDKDDKRELNGIIKALKKGLK
jgi:hypothetical protein